MDGSRIEGDAMDVLKEKIGNLYSGVSVGGYNLGVNGKIYVMCVNITKVTNRELC
jgi:hypothetical protein